MSRKLVPAQAGDRARLEILFDKPQLLGRLFGEYDKNLVAIEKLLFAALRAIIAATIMLQEYLNTIE